MAEYIDANVGLAGAVAKVRAGQLTDIKNPDAFNVLTVENFPTFHKLRPAGHPSTLRAGCFSTHRPPLYGPC